MRILFIYIVVCFLCFSKTFAVDVPNDSIGATKLNGKLHIRYLVSPGETIYGISTKYHVSVSDLLELNNELESGLKVGQVIHIPYEPKIAKAIETEERIVNTPKALCKPDSSALKSSSLNNKVEANKAGKKPVHKVQSGETLYSLAKQYNVSVSDLLKWNNMDLKVGQEIVLEAPQNKDVSNNLILNSGPPTNTTKELAPSKFKEEIVNKYDFDTTMLQVLIIPFDPYLYFSDADDEIAAVSKISRTKVRQVFRRRMNALLDHPAYENIHLLGGKSQDSLTDLNKVYSSVTYNYQEIINNPNYHANDEAPLDKKHNKNWLEKQKDKVVHEEASGKAITSKDNGKYFGVIIKNPEFFKYYNTKYDIDYYIFVNQFEVKTNYENCLDRAAQNYERTFTTHYSIFESSGKQIAGNKFKTHYSSNANNVNQIVGDNMKKITDRIMADLPVPKK